MAAPLWALRPHGNHRSSLSSLILGLVSADGGGIGNQGTVTVINSTVSGNTAGRFGGGIFNNFGTLTLTNSTVSGNTAGNTGGGVLNNFGTLTLANATITSNTAGVAAFGLAFNSIKNTIIAGNTGDDCFGSFASWVSQGYNLIGPSGCPFTSGEGDQLNIDPQLGPLQNNGGPTETHALLEGSPAIDTGNPDGCTDHLGNLLTTDQRGAPRSVDGDGDGAARCDIGAFEFGLQVISVVIDIKPGSDPNSVNPRSKGVIPVAILTTDSFDATTIDPTTVLFGRTGTEAAPVHFAFEDVDRDGDTDMILHFNTQATGIQCGDISASLTGETFGGQAIVGSDSINTAGCK